MRWKQIMFDGDDTVGPAQLQTGFEAVFFAANAPRGAVMMGGFDPFANKYRYFFSPVALRILGALLASYSTENCNRPSQREVPFLVGNEADKESS
jgi:hypothetical protein